MYLARMRLNPRRRQTIRFRNDAQAMHAAVESSFPPSNVPDRNLWRLDGSREEPGLLILSERVPSLEHLQEQAGWETERTWETKSYDPLLSRIKTGQQYAFRLTANPTGIVTGDDGRKRRRAHVSAQYQLEWLIGRGEQIGASFYSADSTNEPESSWNPVVVQRETQRFKRGGSQVTIVRATFQGVLEVASADALREALVNGVGRAKAYGCGSQTLAPVGRGHD